MSCSYRPYNEQTEGVFKSYNQSHDQTTNQSNDLARQLAYHRAEVIRLSAFETTQQDNPSVNQLHSSSDQSFSQLVNASLNRPVHQSINQSINSVPTKQSVTQSVDPSDDFSHFITDDLTTYITTNSVPLDFPNIKRTSSFDESVDRSIEKARVNISQSLVKSCRTFHTPDSSVDQSISQSTNQSNIEQAAALTRLCELARVAFDVAIVQIMILNTDTFDVISRATSTSHSLDQSVALTSGQIEMQSINQSICESFKDFYTVPRAQSFCQFVCATDKQLVIPDLSINQSTKKHFVCSDFEIQFYAATPLLISHSMAQSLDRITTSTQSNNQSINQSIKSVGTLCIMDSRKRLDWNRSSSAILSLFANSAMNLIERSFIEDQKSAFRTHILTNVSHEIRTPIHSIINECEEMRQLINQSVNQSIKQSIDRQFNDHTNTNLNQSITPSTFSESLSEVETQSLNILSIVNDLFDFLKLESNESNNQTANQSKSFSLVEACNDVIDSFRPIIDSQHAQVTLSINQSSPDITNQWNKHSKLDTQSITESSSDRLLGPTREIRQLLSNLLSNSLKYSTKSPSVNLSIDQTIRQPDFQRIYPEHYSHTLTHELQTQDHLNSRPSISQFSNQSPSSCWLYIRVSDNGVGIPAHTLPKLFEDFLQSNKKLSNHSINESVKQSNHESLNQSTHQLIGPGVGLGLIICRLIVQSVGGQLMVESKVDTGTVFHVIMPVHSTNQSIDESVDQLNKQPVSQSINQSISQSNSPANTPGSTSLQRRIGSINNINQSITQSINKSNSSSNSSSPMQLASRTLSPSDDQIINPSVAQSDHQTQRTITPRILVVDDNLINLKVASRILTGANFPHHCVSSGHDAIQLINQSINQPFDVILMDLQMPQMSGMQATKFLRKMESDRSINQSNNQSVIRRPLVIIAVTASETRVDQSDGFDALMTKPFTRQQLTKVIDELLN